MSFVSISFVVFFTIALGLIALTDIKPLKEVDGKMLRHVLLLALNYVFYAIWDWRFCFLMFFETSVAYFAAKCMNGRFRKLAMMVGVTVSLVILCIFKYTNFFLSSFAAAFGIEEIGSLKIILPLGISFYTFQSMSYTLDVYRKKVEAGSFLDLALYVSFFPVVMSGPILKPKDFTNQLKEDRRITLDYLEAGVQIFVLGLFKKIVLADRLSVFVNDIYAKPLAFSSLTVVLGVLAYSLQIYFDFSGYSDMAIGCAKCMGYDLPRNFNLPYLSKNPTEFWKRWHISLSAWLQEYLYISLGGNRKGQSRTYVNLMLTMVLGGLWHGASWNFVIWGLLHGIGLCVHKVYMKLTNKKRLMPVPLAVMLNFSFVSICWVFFRAESFDVALQVLSKVLIWSDGIQQIYAWLVFAVIVEVLYLLWCNAKSLRVQNHGIDAFYFRHNLNTVIGLTLFFFEVMMTIGLAYTGGSPFIYFQF